MRIRASLAACVALLAVPFAAPAADAAASARAKALFERHWEETAKLYPYWATNRGDHRFGDRNTDRSAEGLAREERYWRGLLEDVRALKGAALSSEDRLSLQLLEHIATEVVDSYRHPGLKTMTVNAGFSPLHTSLVRVLRAMPVDSEARAEQVLARMASYPKRIDEELAVLRKGMELKWVPAKSVLERVVSQIDGQLREPIEKSGYMEPFGRMPADIPEAARASLRKRALASVERDVYPAQRKLRDFVAGEYMAAAPVEGGLGRYPGGAEAYAYMVRNETTTSLTPRQVHQLGLDKIASVRAQADALIRSTGFTGDFQAFVKHINADPRHFNNSPEEQLNGYRVLTKRLDAEMPKLFAELPRMTYGVRAIPEYMGPGAVETYNAPSLDGTRPGWFNANIVGYKVRPKFGMPAIAAHETVPGHHIQWARAAELKGLPEFRRASSFGAFNEGWGLYAEVLGEEIGIYDDPYSRFGYLQNQLWRAARLVVDTGLHAEGWTRQRAIDYMVEATGMATERVESEVDRYLSLPGQALSYMVGQLKIQELRARAKQVLGTRFDLRRFHNVVLDSGSLPLDVLERVVDEWVAANR